MFTHHRERVPAGVGALEVDVANSVRAIGERQWGALSFGSAVPEYGDMETLENSRLAFDPLYALAWDTSGLRGVMFGGLWQLRFAPAVRIRIFTTGSPLNIGPPLLLADEDRGGYVTSSLVQALRRKAEDRRARLFIARDFAGASPSALPRLSRLYDCAMLDITWKSFEDYVQERPRRKSIRRDLRSIGNAGYRLEIRSGQALSTMETDRIHALWRQLYDKHRSFDQLFITRDYFANCSLLPQAIFFLLYQGDELQAFDLCFARGKTLESTYCGVNLQSVGRLPVHRTMGYEIVRFAIEHGYQTINFGISNEAVKLEAGCRLESLHGRIEILPAWLDRVCGDWVRRSLTAALGA